MFRCGICDEVQKPRTPEVKVVLETRSTTYPFRKASQRTPRGKYNDDPGGQGYEIVSEVAACKECAARPS